VHHRGASGSLSGTLTVLGGGEGGALTCHQTTQTQGPALLAFPLGTVLLVIVSIRDSDSVPSSPGLPIGNSAACFFLSLNQAQRTGHSPLALEQMERSAWPPKPAVQLWGFVPVRPPVWPLVYLGAWCTYEGPEPYEE